MTQARLAQHLYCDFDAIIDETRQLILGVVWVRMTKGPCHDTCPKTRTGYHKVKRGMVCAFTCAQVAVKWTSATRVLARSLASRRGGPAPTHGFNVVVLVTMGSLQEGTPVEKALTEGHLTCVAGLQWLWEAFCSPDVPRPVDADPTAGITNVPGDHNCLFYLLDWAVTVVGNPEHKLTFEDRAARRARNLAITEAERFFEERGPEEWGDRHLGETVTAYRERMEAAASTANWGTGSA